MKLSQFASKFEGKADIPSFRFIDGMDDAAVVDNIQSVYRETRNGRKRGPVRIQQMGSNHICSFDPSQLIEVLMC